MSLLEAARNSNLFSSGANHASETAISNAAIRPVLTGAMGIAELYRAQDASFRLGLSAPAVISGTA